MPPTRSAYLRYHAIDSLLRDDQHPFPNIERLREECGRVSKGEPVSLSTIEKDLHSMKTDEGIKAPIAWHRTKRGYYYTNPNYSFRKKLLTEEDADELSFALALIRSYSLGAGNESGFVSTANLASLLELSEGQDPAKISRYIQYDTSAPVRGTQYLKPLLLAVRKKLEVKVHYHAFSSDTVGTTVLRPVLLKQYHNTWYVLSLSKNHHAFVYALDRMEGEMKVTRNTFKVSDNFDPKRFFDDVVGVNVPTEKAQRITLEFNEVQAAYARLNPIHSSQTELIPIKKAYRCTITVKINYELITEILRHRGGIKIIHPKSLVSRIRRELKAFL